MATNGAAAASGADASATAPAPETAPVAVSAFSFDSGAPFVFGDASAAASDAAPLFTIGSPARADAGDAPSASDSRNPFAAEVQSSRRARDRVEAHRDDTDEQGEGTDPDGEDDEGEDDEGEDDEEGEDEDEDDEDEEDDPRDSDDEGDTRQLLLATSVHLPCAHFVAAPKEGSQGAPACVARSHPSTGTGCARCFLSPLFLCAV